MSKKIYFYCKDAREIARKVKKGEVAPHILYGMAEAEEEGKIKIIDKYREFPIFSSIVINQPRLAIPLKLLGNKITLININSNHIIGRNQSFFKRIFIKIIYLACNNICCMSEIQFKKLIDLGISPKKIHKTPIGIDEKMIVAFKNNKKFRGKYFFTAGGDAGRKFDKIIKYFSPLVIVSGNIPEDYNNKEIRHYKNLPYTKYLELLADSGVVILDIENGKNSSDCSGSITVLEAIMIGKRIIINNQEWLNDLLPKNSCTIYENELALKMLSKLKSTDFNIENYSLYEIDNSNFKYIRLCEKDYSMFTLEKFFNNIFELAKK